METSWLIRVYRDLRAGSDRVEVGTAYPIADRLVLVARHVVAEHPNYKLWRDIDARKITLTWVNCSLENGKPFDIVPPKTEAEACQIEVKWDGRECGLDAAVLQCMFPPGLKIEKPRLDCEKPKGGEAWSSFGFAQAGLRRETRNPQFLDGKTKKYIKGRTYQLGVDDPVKNPEDLKGLSGAPVFVNGKIQGLITDNAPPYGGGRIEAIPMFLLLKVDGFRDALELPPDEIKPIDLECFITQISQQLSSEESLISRLEAQFRESKLAIEKPKLGAHASQTEARADALARTLVDTKFTDALNILRDAFEVSSAKREERERQILFAIICWFLPVYDPHKAEKLQAQYRSGKVNLIEIEVASALAAELVVSAAQGRCASLARDGAGKGRWMGVKCLPGQRLPLGLGSTAEEEVISTVERWLIHLLDFDSDYDMPPEVYRPSLQEILRDESRRGRDLPYVLLAIARDKDALKHEDLERIAVAIRKVYPPLATLLLSNDVNVHSEEPARLHSLRQILERFNK